MGSKNPADGLPAGLLIFNVQGQRGGEPEVAPTFDHLSLIVI